jgi:hypothetical protein
MRGLMALSLLDVLLVVWPANVGLGVLITYFLGATEWMDSEKKIGLLYVSFHLFFMGSLLSRILIEEKMFLANWGRFEDSIFKTSGRHFRLWMWLLMLGAAAMRTINFFRYGVIVSGTSQTDIGMSYSGFVLMNMASSIEPLLVATIALVVARDLAPTWEKAFCAVCILIFQMLDGRALFLFAVFTLFYFWIKVRGELNRRILVIGALSVAAAFLLVFPVFKTFQYNIRERSATGARVENQDVIESAARVLRGELANEAENVADFNRQDLGRSGRFYWVSWNAMVIDGVSASGAIGGGVTINDISFVLPRFVKGQLIETDNYIQQGLRLPIFDATTNVVAIAYADFGLAGCLIYGFLFPAFVMAISLLCSALFRSRPLILLLIYSVTLKSFFSFENCFSITLVPFRSALLLALALFPFVWSGVAVILRRPKLRAPESARSS